MQDSSDFGLIVRRQDWSEDDTALLCGIANAGGGRIFVSPKFGSHSKKMKRLRKSFETIPRIARKELGMECTTEPTVDGAGLCLEIKVPPALSPLQFQGMYYLYSDGVNMVVTKDLLMRLSNVSEAAIMSDADRALDTPGATDEADDLNGQSPQGRRAHAEIRLDALESDGRPSFKHKSVAAANRLDLTSTDEYVLKVLRTNGRATAPRIADVLVVSESTVRRSFRKLREYGLIERIGSRKSGYWRIVD